MHALDDSFGSDVSSESEDEVFFGRGTASDEDAETEEETRARLRCEEKIRADEAAALRAAAEAAMAAAEAVETAVVEEQPLAPVSPPLEECVESDPADASPPEADSAGSILTQVRATILKLKQGRSTIGVPAGAHSKVTKLTLTGASSLPVLRTATSSRIPTPASTAHSAATKPATNTAQPAAALTLSRAQPVPSATNAPAAASQPTRAPIASAAPVPMVAAVAVPAATAASASKLSTLASSMQLASPAPMRKTMSVFRTASIQAQVAALNKSATTQQQQQIATMPAAPSKPAQPVAIPSALSARPASASVSSATSSATSAAPLLLSARPVSASAAVTTAAAPAAALFYRTPARRNVVWRDEDASQSSQLGPLAGQLEEVKFMSPTLSPEKEGASGGLSLSASYSAFTAARARAKPMPDLSKTPTKSCLRRTVTSGSSATVAAPIMPVPLSYMQGFTASSSSAAAASLDAPIVAPAPVSLTSVASVSTSAQRILHPAPSTAGVYSGVQSGARRVPNLTKVGLGTASNGGVASVGGATGALRTLSLNPSQPQAAAFPSIAAAAAVGGLEKTGASVGSAITNAYLLKKPVLASSGLNTLSANNSGLTTMR